MRSILTAIKTELPTNLTWIKDIEVVADEDVIPSGVRFPFIGLKDGDIEREEGFSNTLTERLAVHIIMYQEILKREASIMGVGSKKGVLEMAEDVHGELNENFLNLAGVDRVFCPEETASQLLVSPDGNKYVQKKRLTYVYERTT